MNEPITTDHAPALLPPTGRQSCWHGDLASLVGGERTCGRCGASISPRLAVSFEIVTPESSEDGDTAETGWESDPDGDLLEWDTDPESGESLASEATRLIGRFVEPSSTVFHPGIWYTDSDARQDRAYFEKGEDYRRSYHLIGFTESEQREVFDRVTA